MNLTFFVFLSGRKRHHSRFYRSVFSIFPPKNSLFPKKIPFCQFYPEATIALKIFMHLEKHGNLKTVP
jgi:hypothetical protein